MTLHSGYLPGCIGRIAELHGAYYGRTAGFGVPFEAKVARELAEFCLRYDPEQDGLWLWMDGGRIHGSVVIDGVHADSDGAHLRWFIASDETRGRGAGNALMSAAMAFCGSKGYRKAYRKAYLWTFDQLHAARHLYEKHGFVLDSQQPGSTWGRPVNEQKFVRHG